MNFKSINNLFLQQSYQDTWQEYQTWLEKGSSWDFIILTASNESQASGYRKEVAYRLEQGYLSADCEYLVLSDPDGKRVGSGGATFNVLRYLSQQYGDGTASIFHGKKILVIHSGGDSKRVPQYSVCGKLFSPVPRMLEDGRPSTLFDEFMISMAAVALRFEEGMLVLSGDVLLLFNPLQLDFQFKGAAAISMKADVGVGKEHGVFLNNGQDYVSRFLHKQPEEQLRSVGAVNDSGKVDIDTGAVLLDADLLEALFSLLCTEGHYDSRKFAQYVNERSRVSFYGDFLYPLASSATFEEYCLEAPEGEMCQELLDCRKEIWKVLHFFSMKLISLSPAEFIHFGTTRELLDLMTREIGDYYYLGWNPVVNSNRKNAEFAVYNSIISPKAMVCPGSYIENSILGDSAYVVKGSIVSGTTVLAGEVPSGVVLHGLALPGEKYVVRIYGVEDNPKDIFREKSVKEEITGEKLTGEKPLGKKARWLGEYIKDVLDYYQIQPEKIWRNTESYLWFAELYPVCDTREDALKAALAVYDIFHKKATRRQVESWLSSERLSLYSSFNLAQAEDVLRWNRKLIRMVAVECFLDGLRLRDYYRDALQVFAHKPMTEGQFREILHKAEQADFGLKIRIFYSLSKYLRGNMGQIGGVTAQKLEEKCFGTIQEAICKQQENHPKTRNRHIRQEICKVSLPVRVNWGGGWTDTPPYCNENGGIVLNAAIKIKGRDPVQVIIKRLEEYHVEFASEDIGVTGTFTDLEDILDCKNPYDHFALHKAALIACGIVKEPDGEGRKSRRIEKTIEEPDGWIRKKQADKMIDEPNGEIGKRFDEEKCSADRSNQVQKMECLPNLLRRFGGGIYLSTKVTGIPKGSGLGTSSILAGACVKAIYEFLGETLTDEELYDTVLRMEQLMSTGGGWQDQVGGLCPGIKLITSKPGMRQQIQVEQLKIPDSCLRELQERFVLIYTGQRRLARNLLRDVVGNYIGGRPESVKALEAMKRTAVLMKFELENGNVDRFANLLNEHWELSLQLDKGASNTCIDLIFKACEDLIDGRFIAGAGGGGFLQAVLKKGVTAEQLNRRLHEVFQDAGVAVWECEFVNE